jgi:hypothetical protein
MNLAARHGFDHIMDRDAVPGIARRVDNRTAHVNVCLESIDDRAFMV